MPEKEAVKSAIKWISINLEEDGKKTLPKIIDEAVFIFDLSPIDMEFLTGFFHNHPSNSKLERVDIS